MEERGASWGEAFGIAINNLTGVDTGKSATTVRLGFLLLFILGTAWAGYNYYMADPEGLLNPEGFLAEKYYEPRSRPNQAQADKTRLDNMLNQVKATSELRTNSTVITDNMAVLAKYPFRDPALSAPPSMGVEVEIPTIPVVAIDYPPAIAVRAIMIMGNERIALMDIPDVGDGMVVKAGDTFARKNGRVMRITPEKVVIRWGGKNWDIAPSF